MTGLFHYIIGTLTEFVNGTCPESCNAEPTDQPPMRIDIRECVNASFGGNCFDAALNRSAPCNENVGCSGKGLQKQPPEVFYKKRCS